MIYAVATRRSDFAFRDYLQTDGDSVAGLITVLTYEQLLDTGVLPIGAYLFAGLDELTPTESRLVTRAHQVLAEASPSCPRFNDPDRWLRRSRLLQAAFEAGHTTFRATRATDLGAPRRFPVFIRSEPEHTGALSPLLHDEGAVVRALLHAMIRGYRLRDLLIVEYSDTASPDGVFTKYSAMILGSTIVARSHTQSREWMTKYTGRITDAAAADADLAFVEANPHEEWQREMFALGGVEYGRIDYALLHGRPVLWEINTNPTIGANLKFEPPTTDVAAAADGAAGAALRRMQRGNRLFYVKFAAAVESLSRATDAAIAADGSGSKHATMPISNEERQRLAVERRRRERVLARQTVLGRLFAPVRAGYRILRAR